MTTAVLRVSANRIAVAVDSCHLRRTCEGDVTASHTDKLVAHRRTVGVAAGLTDAELPDGSRWDLISTLRHAVGSDPGQPIEELIRKLRTAVTPQLDQLRTVGADVAATLGANSLFDGAVATFTPRGVDVAIFGARSDGGWWASMKTVTGSDAITIALGHHADTDTVAALHPGCAPEVLEGALQQAVLAAAASAPRLWGHLTVGGPIRPSCSTDTEYGSRV